jgi:enolase-phosphatase E1
VAIRLRERGIGAVLLDIEGTTTPIAFVHEVLFPYARTHLRAFLDAHDGDPIVAEAARLFAIEHAGDVRDGENPPALGSDLEPYARWLMDRDRKSPGLKLLQGHVWEEGYQRGELHGQVFDDVAPAIRRWREAGVSVAIYSSGSELAQRRLFESTPAGNLAPLFDGFFDTRVGGKLSPESYRAIADRLARQPREVVFVSDVAAELRAASGAGLQILLCVRPGNRDEHDPAFERVRSFDEIVSL